MIRKYAQNLLSRVKRSENSVQGLWLPKSPTFSSVRMKRYQFAGPLRQSHPESLSAVPEVLEKSNPPQISFFPNLHCQPSPPSSLRKLMTAPCESHPLYLTDIDLFVRRTICTTQHWNMHEANFSQFDAKLEITVSEYSILTQN